MSSRRATAVVTLVLAAVSTTACARNPRAGAPVPAGADGMTPEAWVRSVLPRLSLEDRVAQMIVVAGEGGFTNVRSPAARQTERLVDELHVGGILLAPGTPLDVAVRLNALQRRSPLPLLVAADVEWGAGRALPDAWLAGGVRAGGGTVLPTALGLSATGNPMAAELAGRVTGREARAVGVHWLLGPVVDVAQPRSGATLLARSFGADPALVARQGESWVRGARSAGALTTLRHFPGEGASRVSADDLLAVVEADSATIDRHDLVPFGAILRAGTDAVMLGHAAVPAFTGDRTTPAALEKRIATDLLRGRLGYQGLVVTPPLDAQFQRTVPALSPGETAVLAVLAGADVLLAPADPVVTHRAVVTAVRAGRIPYGRIEESVQRILLTKARVGLAHERTTSLDSVAAIVAAPEHEDIAARLAAESITLVRDSLGLVPVDPRRVHRLAVIGISADGETRAGERLAAELRSTYGAGVSFHRIAPLTADSVLDAAVTQAGRAQIVVLAVFAPLDAGPERARVAGVARRFAARVAGVNPRLILATFGDPLLGADRISSGTSLLAWQPHGEHAQTALANALAGSAPITGRLPFPLLEAQAVHRNAVDYELTTAPPASVGMDPAALARVDEIMVRGVAAGAAPGAAIAVGRHGRLVMLKGYGRLDLRRGFDAVTDSSIYDLASLTKVIGTTSALAILVDRGLIDLDAPVQRYIPEWRGSPAREAVTIRNLMRHDAGLPAYAPLYQTLRGRDEYRRHIAAMELAYVPGQRTVYSDFGVILVGFIIEQLTGQTLDAFLQREVLGPLGLRDTGYNPLQWPYGTMSLEDQGGPAAPSWLIQRIAPTELDTVFRFTQVHGRVHDENAFAIGGVAGHAGLFSSARDLAIFAQLMLNRGFYGGRRYFDPGTVERFTTPQSAASSRGIGWDTPSSENSSAGEYFTSSSFGHTGFTGTSIWMDPERDVFVVLLTNRVNFGRDNQRHVALRRAVADAVQLAIRDQPVRSRGGDLTVSPVGSR